MRISNTSHNTYELKIAPATPASFEVLMTPGYEL